MFFVEFISGSFPNPREVLMVRPTRLFLADLIPDSGSGNLFLNGDFRGTLMFDLSTAILGSIVSLSLCFELFRGVTLSRVTCRSDNGVVL